MSRYRLGRTAAAMTLLVITSGQSGCSGGKTSAESLQLVDPARGEELIRARSGFLGIGSSGQGAWVDPRTAAEFTRAHIPGAVHLPYQHVSTDHDRLRDYDVLIVYGNDYNDPKAEAMSKRLMELGFDEVFTLHGGLRAWTADGRDTESTSPDDLDDSP